MATKEQVLSICMLDWEDDASIVKRYDAVFPPRWYELGRQILRALGKPTVSLDKQLAALCKEGAVEYSYSGMRTHVDGNGIRHENLKRRLYRVAPALKIVPVPVVDRMRHRVASS